MKVSEALNLKNFLDGNSKTDKMGMSRVTLVMMLVKLGKVHDEYMKLYQSVLDGLKKDVKDFDENVSKARDYEMSMGDKPANSVWNEEDYLRFMNGDFKKVNEPLQVAMKEELEKEVDVEFKKFDVQGFGEWMESNNVDASKAAVLAQYLLDM